MKILHENTDIAKNADQQIGTFVGYLKQLDKLYKACKEGVKLMQNMEMTATHGVTLPDIVFHDSKSQESPVAGLLSEPPEADEVEYLASVNKKMGNILDAIK